MESSEVRFDSPSAWILASQWYDANISLPGCDKNMPGTVIAMARLNRPSLMVYGGTINPGVSSISGDPIDVISAFQSYGDGRIAPAGHNYIWVDDRQVYGINLPGVDILPVCPRPASLPAMHGNAVLVLACTLQATFHKVYQHALLLTPPRVTALLSLALMTRSLG